MMQISLHVFSVFILFNGRFYSCTSQYATNSTLECFFQSSVVPVTMVRGLKVSDTPILTGKALIHMTTDFSSSTIILFGMQLNGILMYMDCALYFITRNFPSIFRTCFLIAVGLIFNPGKSGIRQ